MPATSASSEGRKLFEGRKRINAPTIIIVINKRIFFPILKPLLKRKRKDN
jgi:hypothetical protein